MKIASMARVMMGVFVMALVMAPLTASAVTGQCANCHVMHASQAGVANPATAQGYLLKYTDGCLGCHGTGDNTVGGGVLTSTPQVYKAGGLANPLAGGDFYYSENGAGDRKGHNPLVTGVLAKDATYATPPGWAAGFALNTQVGTIDGTAGKELTCSGVYGCHGRHDGTAEAMHHANTTGVASVVDGTTLGKSFRFLKGIAGGEDDDYQYESAVDHNIYIGANRAAGAADDTAGGANTVSYFCAECHGIFHSGAGNDGLASGNLGSPWLRHPVDFSMPLAGEYAVYNAYNPLVPVATSDAARLLTDNTVEGASERIVMCLSCHYAHAGPNDAALRWDYSKMLAGTALVADYNTGCFACHTAKDGNP